MESEQLLGAIHSSYTNMCTFQHAETLRLRLRVALYKVQTNQTKTPLSELTLPTYQQPTPSLTLSSTNSSHPSVPSITLSPARHQSLTNSSAFPRLLPAPVLLPTAYSSRMITESHIPSSPPSTRTSPDRSKTAAAFATPIARRRVVQQSDRESEDEDTDEGDGDCEMEMLQRRREQRFEDGDLTSSVVKGRAASGLLELMRAA